MIRWFRRPCGACLATGWVVAVRPRIGICIVDCAACEGTGTVKR